MKRPKVKCPVCGHSVWEYSYDAWCVVDLECRCHPHGASFIAAEWPERETEQRPLFEGAA